jgi:hypothetical protein
VAIPLIEDRCAIQSKPGDFSESPQICEVSGIQPSKIRC